MALSSSPRVTGGLLGLPALATVLGDTAKYGCAFLEQLDNLCNLIGLQVQPHATSSDKDTSRTQN